MGTTYEHTAAYDAGHLPVSDLHTLYYEQYGDPDGKPVLFLHGGPGGSTSIANTVFFDPKIYRVVLLDQRGAGKSEPTAELKENTTIHLIADIEILRQHLDIEYWHLVFGGSWGSTLALLYAESFPERTKSLVLRGIFLVRRAEVEWGFPTRGSGASQLFPDAAEEFLKYFTEEELKDWERSTYNRLISDDRKVRVDMARAFNVWDIKRSSLIFNPDSLEKIEDERWSIHHATLEHTYLMNGCWLRENQILEELDKIRNIPCIIVQGRYDAVCPMQSAWDLHRAWPESRLVIVPDAGHSATDPGALRALVKACDELAKL